MSIQFGFSFADASGDHEPETLKFDNQEMPTWDETLSRFLDFLGTVYGYSIREELSPLLTAQAAP